MNYIPLFHKNKDKFVKTLLAVIEGFAKYGTKEKPMERGKTKKAKNEGMNKMDDSEPEEEEENEEPEQNSKAARKILTKMQSEADVVRDAFNLLIGTDSKDYNYFYKILEFCDFKEFFTKCKT